MCFCFINWCFAGLTFYNWNRWYLLGYTAIAFFIPFINISTVVEQNDWSGKSIIEWVPSIVAASVSETAPATTQNIFTVWNLAGIVILSGIVIMMIRLLIQFISFWKMKRKAEFISGVKMKIFHVDENIIPFSFGNSIFINRALHSETELQEIIRHEFVHARQVHSIDIIWGEIVCLLNWYNPFAWLLKRSIRQNLEFIADHKVLENGINKKEYQYLLLKVIGNNQYSIANQFNFSSLKKRIAMMNKLKSARLHLVKFLFILPVLGLTLVAFREQITGTVNDTSSINVPVILNDTVPASDKLPDNVQRISVRQDKATVTLKDGTREEYDLSSATQKNEFEKKYGEVPPPPPPPPAAPAPPPPPPPPAPPTPPAPPELPDNVQRINVNNDKATVWLKDGAKERYDLSNPSQKKDFEKKYGQVPPPPPPVPPVPPVPAIAPVEPLSKNMNGKLNDVAKEFEITDKKAVIKLKNGGVEEYDLTNKTERKAFESKYGKLYDAGPIKANAVAPVAYVGGSGKTVIAPMALLAGEQPIMVDGYGYAITGKEDILVTITKSTTRNQLDDFVRQMKEKGIELHFENINYNDGILTEITGYMKSKDGRSNFVATDFSKLVLAMIKKGDRTYFKVSVKDDKVSV